MQQQEAKGNYDRKQSSSDNAKYRLLGELPTLAPNKDKQQQDVKIALSLELHNNISGISSANGGSNSHNGSFMKAESKSSGGGGSDRHNGATNADPAIPKV